MVGRVLALTLLPLPMAMEPPPACALGPGGSTFYATLAPFPGLSGGSGEGFFGGIEMPHLESSGWETDMVRLRFGWQGMLLADSPAAFKLKLETTVGMEEPTGGGFGKPDQFLALTVEKSLGALKTGLEVNSGALGEAVLSRNQDHSTALLARAEYPVASFGRWQGTLKLDYTAYDLAGTPHGRAETRFELGEDKSKFSLGIWHAEDNRETRAEIRFEHKF